MAYYSTKTYDHNEGLSCAFRQWKATHSHCRWIHGYALAVKFTFGAHKLDDRNWVQDFGGLKDIKQWLKQMFDHTLCISEDDPELDKFKDIYFDLCITNADVNLFNKINSKKKYVISYSLQSLEKFIRKKQLFSYLKHKPKILVLGNYHKKNRSWLPHCMD